MNPTCETCRWWDRTSGLALEPGIVRHRCRRHPPQIRDFNPHFGPEQPATLPYDWCGDHMNMLLVVEAWMGDSTGYVEHALQQGIPIIPCEMLDRYQSVEVWDPPLTGPFAAGRFDTYGPEDRAWMEPLGLGKTTKIQQIDKPLFVHMKAKQYRDFRLKISLPATVDDPLLEAKARRFFENPGHVYHENKHIVLRNFV